MNDLIDVHAEKGVLVTTSRNVAEVFGKNHADVMRDVRNILANLSDTDRNWGISNFADTPLHQPSEWPNLFRISHYQGWIDIVGDGLYRFKSNAV